MPCSPYKVIIVGADDSRLIDHLRSLQRSFANLELNVIAAGAGVGRSMVCERYFGIEYTAPDPSALAMVVMRGRQPRLGTLQLSEFADIYERNFSEPAEYPDRNGNKSRNPMCPSGGRQYQKRRGKGRM